MINSDIEQSEDDSEEVEKKEVEYTTKIDAFHYILNVFSQRKTPTKALCFSELDGGIEKIKSVLFQKKDIFF